MPKFVEVPTEDWLTTIADAKRYRWLRVHSWLDASLTESVLNFGPGYDQTKPETLDAAIDAFSNRIANERD